ncbi:MAG TPA: M56 family metallopeptidase, partial [Silvibacterium sp.]|nr:M56 family metallopeptidase [Silvibacterium sp.]
RASPILEPRASVRISASLQSPVTIGSGIVLPANYTEWDRAKLRLVLAHERAHIRQGDFYLQLLASLYAALVWFSPLGWWLKHKLADLGEAISDRAAMAEIEDRSSYAEVLLEFAAMPRRSLIGVSAGVGMARSSNIQRRIERILNDRTFRLAFLGSRRHAVTAAVLVPIALAAATSLVRVQAAQVVALPPKTMDEPTANVSTVVVPKAPAPVVPETPMVYVAVPSPKPAAMIRVARVSAVPFSLQVAAQSTASQSTSAPSSGNSTASNSDMRQSDSETFSYNDDDKESYAVISGTNSHVMGQGNFGDEFTRVRRTMQGDYIWVERNGKSYVITDPALIAKSRELFKPEEELGQRQAALGASQAALGEQQATLGEEQSKVKLSPAELAKALAGTEDSLKELQALKTQEVSQVNLAEVQARLGELQGKLGAAEAKIAEKQAVVGGQQAELGIKQAALGSQQAELGREQARVARQASRQMRALIDGAFRDGQAKPVK